MAKQKSKMPFAAVQAIVLGMAAGFTKAAELCRAWYDGKISGGDLFTAIASVGKAEVKAGTMTDDEADKLRNRVKKAFTQGLRQIKPDQVESDTEGLAIGDDGYLLTYPDGKTPLLVTFSDSGETVKIGGKFREVKPETIANRVKAKAAKDRKAAIESAGAQATVDPFETALAGCAMIDAAYQATEGSDRTKLDALVLDKLAKMRHHHGLTLSEADLATMQAAIDEAAANKATSKGATKPKDVTATRQAQ